MHKKNVAKIIIAANVLVMMMQLGVMLKIIPHTWLNGGRVMLYDRAFVVSIVSIIIFTLMTIYLIQNWMIKADVEERSVTRTRYSLLVFWGVSLLMQLLGTNFERFFMSLVCLVPVIVLIRMKVIE